MSAVLYLLDLEVVDEGVRADGEGSLVHDVVLYLLGCLIQVPLAQLM